MRMSERFTNSQEYKKVVKDLLSVAEDTVRKRKKGLSHLRFAKPTKYGWFFFKKKNVPWEIHEGITHIVWSSYPQYGKGEIAHMFSELINMGEKDLFQLRATVNDLLR